MQVVFFYCVLYNILSLLRNVKGNKSTTINKGQLHKHQYTFYWLFNNIIEINHKQFEVNKIKVLF